MAGLDPGRDVLGGVSVYRDDFDAVAAARDFKSALGNDGTGGGHGGHFAAASDAAALRFGDGNSDARGGGNDADRGLAVDLEQLQPRSEPGQSHRQQWLHGDLDGLVSFGAVYVGGSGTLTKQCGKGLI